MKVRELIHRLGENVEEVLEKAVQCQTPGDLIQLAQDNNIALSQAEASEVLEIMHAKPGELSESELDTVTGGIAESTGKSFCPRCGGKNLHSIGKNTGKSRCLDCNHEWYLVY